MPKIIENVRERLLEEARRQMLEDGYANMTIRSVAGACGVGVGTVYNYFSSKDMLIAGFMLTDWQQCTNRIGVVCREQAELAVSPKNVTFENTANDRVLRCIYNELRNFMQTYAALFQDESAGVSFSTAFPQRHKLLRSQIAEPLQVFLSSQTKAKTAFLADFIAESMLTWTLDGQSYEEIGSLLLKLM